MSKGPGPRDPRFLAGLDLLKRTGVKQVQIRYSDDEKPVVWMTVAIYKHGIVECAAALNPLTSVMRILSLLIDGGQCMHCLRPTGVSEDFAHTMPLPGHICWYQYDPELKTFRRGCEGDN